MKPKISIVLPVYNNEKYFPNVVRDVLKQTFHDFELIIVDDGSTDNTGYIADKLAEKDKRIKVIHQENKWIYESFNTGIKHSTGKYIFIINSDDMLPPDLLYNLNECTTNHEVDIVCCCVQSDECDENQNVSRFDIYNMINTVPKDAFVVTDVKELRNKWFKLLKQGMVNNPIKMYKSNIFENHKFRNDVYGADFLFNAEIADEISSIAYNPKCIYHQYVYNSDTMNASVGKYYGYEHDMFNEFFTIYYDLFSKWDILDEEKENYLIKNRMGLYTSEFKMLLYSTCRLNLEEKLTKAWEWANDLYDFAVRYDRQEEFEARTLSGIKNIILLHYGESAGSMQFIVDYLDNILRYEKTEKDMKKIKNAVYNEKNLKNIGETFYKKIYSGKHLQDGVYI